MSIDRRRLLKFAGAAMTVGLAGCSENGGEESDEPDGSDGGSDGSDGGSGGGSDGGDGGPDGSDSETGGEVPEYTRWLTTNDQESVFYVYMDWEAGDAVDAGGSTPTATQAPGSTGGASQDMPDDPMLGLPISGAFLVAFGAGLGLAPFGLNGLLEGNGAASGGMGGSGMGGGGMGTTEGPQLSSRATEVLFTNSVIVLTGDIDPDEIGEQLTSEPETMFEQQFEAGEEIAGHTVYEPVETTATEGMMGSTGGGDSVIAVGDGAVLFRSSDEGGGTPIEALRGPIEAAAGEATRATDEIDDFAWLVTTGGNGDMSYGAYGQAVEGTATPTPTPDDGTGGIGGGTGGGSDSLNVDYAILERANGIASSLTVDESGEGGSSEFAGIVPGADESALRETLGYSAAESSLEVDGDRVTATATWDEIDT